MSDTTATPPVPAGWYADPNLPGQVRWWDGTTWTDHTNPSVARAPYVADAPPAVDPSLPVYNAWIWAALVVGFLPLAILPIWLPIYLRGFVDLVPELASSAAPDMSSMYGALFSPIYLAAAGFGVLCAAAGIVFAYFDSKALLKAGMVRPFHWAWSFLDGYGVYIIGRSVVARRRAGRGIAPMVIWITIEALIFIASFVGTIILIVVVAQTAATLATELNLH